MDSAGNPPIGSRPSARLAIIFLARADYNFQLALDNFENAVNAGDEEVVADAMAEDEREERAREMQRRRQHAKEVGAKPLTNEPSSTQASRTSPSFPINMLTTHQQDMARWNSNIDREPAKLGKRDNSKLSITFLEPGKTPRVHRAHQSPATMDWASPAEIRSLNRWRAQLFLYVFLSPFPSSSHPTFQYLN